MAEHDYRGKRSHIRCKAIIEVLGKPKEHVETAIETYVEHIKKDSSLVVLHETFSDIKEHGKLYTKFVELDMVVKGTDKLVSFCFEYMPSSLEIVKPHEFMMTNNEIAGFINDLQARLHNVDMIVKQLKGENDFLKSNMNKSIMNLIKVCLSLKHMDLKQLSKGTGIHEKELKDYLDKMLADKAVKKEKDVFSLA